MSNYEPEDLYVVVKWSNLTNFVKRQVVEFLEKAGIRAVDCVVVEGSWPIYDETWENVQRMYTKKPSIKTELAELSSALEDAERTVEFLQHPVAWSLQWPEDVNSGNLHLPTTFRTEETALKYQGKSKHLAGMKVVPLYAKLPSLKRVSNSVKEG